MDFHSLLRRDLQFLCKRNKIPANMTNVAMADALESLEIVEGLDEYMNQSNANAPFSPTSVAKLPPNTATRTTRKKTAIKAEPQASSQLTSKSLAEVMDQEPKTNNVKFESSVLKTPAVRSTRKASAAISCKKDELVQSVYSTRRSTRLLEKCMADLSLKTKETLDDKPAKNEESEQKVSAQEKTPAGSEENTEEAEVIPGRDLSASMEKEWEVMKNDSDHEVEDLEIHVDLNDTNTEIKEDMNEIMADEKVQAEESLRKIENDEKIGDSETEPEEDPEIHVDLNDVDTETNMEKMNEVMADEKAVQEEETTLKAEESLKKNENVEKIDESETEPEEDSFGIDLDNTISEAELNQAVLGSEIHVDLIDVVADEKEQVEETLKAEESLKKNENEEKIDESETESEEDSFGVDLDDDAISEAESNQAVLGSEIADEEMTLSETESSDTALPASPIAAESISVQFPRPNLSATPLKNSAIKLVSVDNKENMEMMSGEEKAEEVKKVMVDEESLKSVSMRQLVKMVKELSIKNNNRRALAILPDSNQISE